ncbi:MAG: DUF2868 domain-containing protein [Desulfobacteraceae bacterium]|nr:DUF2868 domain-containing protein [Desulfobacteraceae bacterium]
MKHPIFHKSLDTMTYTAALIHLKQKEYQNIFFWLFFVLSSIFALCFSLGVLGATFFRVVTSDLAFGWQSTLFAGDDTIYRIVATMAKPWSWFVSDSIAHPTLDQIEGTRMILKEGMISLATKDLVSWWPFLCFGILFYAVLPRMILIGAGVAAQRNAVANFDIHAPRFKQLLLRMKNPFLDISSEEDEDLENRVDNRKYRQSFELNKPLKMKENLTAHQLEKALILASPVVYPVDCMAGIENKIKKDLGFTIEKTIPIDFDLNRDVQALTDAKIHCPAHVVLLQEVWQPPIRERLHYLKEVKNTYFADQTLWIFLTQNPMEKSLGVNGEDMNFKVWKKAVTLLENSGIAVQRCRP